MPLLTTSVPNLVQGVSQQPDNLRFPGQAETQVNAFSSVVDGLNKRPHTEHIAKLTTNTIEDDALVHFIDRDEHNKHVVVFNHTSGTTNVSIYSALNGSSIPLVSIASNAQLYLNSALAPLSDLRALTVADSTFIANKNATPKLGSDLSDPLAKEALVFVTQGAFNTNYTVAIDGADTVSIQTGATAGDADSESIASSLAAGLTGIAAGSVSGVTITNPGSGYLVGTEEVTFSELGTNPNVYHFKRVQQGGGYHFYERHLVEVEFSGGGGQGAKGTAVINSSGQVTGVNITHGGSGYTSPPTFTVVGKKTDRGYHLTAWELNLTFGEALYFGGIGGASGYPNYISSGIGSVATGTGTVASGAVNAERQGSLIKVSKTDGTDFQIASKDGLSNTGLRTIYKEVSFISDLPKQCFDGFKVKIIGDVELNQDDYFVKFETKDNESFGEGSWIECTGWRQDGTTTGQTESENINFDYATLPVQLLPLTYASDNVTIASYCLKTVVWSGRNAGSLATNPPPSFVNNPINDIFFFKNRLGFLTDNNVIFSEADAYFNFWRTTTQSLLDSAPIDVGVAHTKVSTLKHAVPFQEKLVLFSPQSQFVLRGAELLTPKTVNITPITEYNVSSSVKPLALTNYVYFSFPRNQYEGMYEFYVDKDTDVFDASEITAQVPTYIPSSLRQLVGTPSEDIIVASSQSDLKKLYVYRYFWQNKEKIQSAWMRFDFARDIVGTGFIDSDLFVVTKDGYLEKMSMEAGHVDIGKTYALHLDRRVSSSALSPSYSASTKLTTVSGMPYDPVNAVVYTASGTRVSLTRVSSTSFTLEGDYSSTSFFVGLEYEALFEFSTPTLKQPTQKGGSSSSNFTNQILRNGAIEYSDTGHFTVEVTPLYRDTYNYAFNPSSLGADSVIGSLVLDSGSFRFPIHSKHDDVTIKVKSSSALPMKLLSAEFESFIHARSRRYG
tara:strand:- start:2074 stop:4932 length:2859 start_codon:yes stop_codon:yes gene_type:complete